MKININIMKLFIYILLPYIVYSNYNLVLRNKFLRLYIGIKQYKNSLKNILSMSKLSIEKMYDNIQINYGKLYYEYDTLNENDKYMIESIITLLI
jgi:hypothetical protein